MIQRIQSLYLLLASCCIGLMFLFPLAWFEKESIQQVFMLYGILDATGLPVLKFYSLTGLAGLLVFLFLFILFRYKNRKAQLRLCRISFIILLGIVVLPVFYMMKYSQMHTMVLSVSMTLVLPVLSGVFTWLAVRGIKKDEELVRSMDRIR